MKTILFNTDTNEPLGKAREGYYTVDGQRPELPANIVELEISETERPEIDEIKQFLTNEFQRNGNLYEKVWVINNRTAEEINEVLNMLDRRIEPDAIKKLLQTIVAPIVTDEAALTEQTIEEIKSVFKQYRVGVEYDKDSTDINKRYFLHKETLYKVISVKHTSQADWTPETAVSLYVEVTPPGVIATWKQPTGAHDAYKIGDKVTYKGAVWVSQINANTTVPDGDVPWNRYWKPE